ncbi:MAG TPA: sulfur carrier protein ThiS [Candidatus Polarisedimenticolaceae bacterium]|nr:sulfur carrier protein ThiS [Candidatus Polarisedimenticolaceae bacterium]
MGSTIIVNGESWPRELASIEVLLRELGHDPTRPGIAVAVNDEVVPRREWPRRPLRFGDRVEIVGAVQGG